MQMKLRIQPNRNHRLASKSNHNPLTHSVILNFTFLLLLYFFFPVPWLGRVTWIEYDGLKLMFYCHTQTHSHIYTYTCTLQPMTYTILYTYTHQSTESVHRRNLFWLNFFSVLVVDSCSWILLSHSGNVCVHAWICVCTKKTLTSWSCWMVTNDSFMSNFS